MPRDTVVELKMDRDHYQHRLTLALAVIRENNKEIAELKAKLIAFLNQPGVDAYGRCPTDYGIQKWPPNGRYDGIACTCTTETDPTSRDADCNACRAAYYDAIEE